MTQTTPTHNDQPPYCQLAAHYYHHDALNDHWPVSDQTVTDQCHICRWSQWNVQLDHAWCARLGNDSARNIIVCCSVNLLLRVSCLQDSIGLYRPVRVPNSAEWTEWAELGGKPGHFKRKEEMEWRQGEVRGRRGEAATKEEGKVDKLW